MVLTDSDNVYENEIPFSNEPSLIDMLCYDNDAQKLYGSFC